MKLIVAVDADWGIGYKGDLLARVRADLMHFKELCTGKSVIYGSNTLATFPGGRPLKGRKNIVLHPSAAFQPEGATVVHSLEELFVYTGNHPEEEFYVIGGCSVYAQLLPYCDTAYVTKFEKRFEKDVYFENLDEHPDWALVKKGEQQYSAEGDTTVGMPFVFAEYKRVRH